MLDAIEIPIEVHDRFSRVLGGFRAAIAESSREAESGAKAFEGWRRKTDAFGGGADSAAKATSALAGASAAAGVAAGAASAAFGEAGLSLQETRGSAEQLGAALGGLPGMIGDCASSFLQAAGDFLRAGCGLAESLAAGFTATLNDLLAKAIGGLKGILESALSGLGASLSGLFGNLFSALSGGLTLGLGSLFGAVAGAVASFFGGIFAKPDVEEYARSSAAALAGKFGVALTAELEVVIKNSAARIAAVTGKEMRRHMADAQWMPETISYIVGQLEDFGAAVQDSLARTLEDSTKAVLMNVMRLSEGEAARAMAGTFEAVIGKALAAGEALSGEMLRMLEWAQRAGAEIAVPAEAFEAALQKLIEAGEVGSAEFDNLIRLAGQVGLSLEEGLAGGLAALQAELEGINAQILGMFERELDFRERRAESKREFVQAAIEELQAEDATLSREEARAKALERYRALQGQVAALFADGVVTLDEIRAATEGMTQAEKAKFIELAKQRQERLAIRRESKEEERLRQTQEKLLAAINRLAKALGGEFIEAGRTLASFQGSLDSLRAGDLGLARQLRDASRLLRALKGDLSGIGGGVDYRAVSGQGGFDYLFRGPAAGYPVPVVLHGSERLTASPVTGGGGGSVVFNISLNAGSADAGRAAGEAFVETVQRALDTKRLLVPGFSIDSTRV